MDKTLIDENAAQKIETNRYFLKTGSWGGIDHACMMSVLVSGAKCVEDCVTAGWPEWLVRVNVTLFDAETFDFSPTKSRYKFALDVAKSIQQPRDYDRARDLFLISRLKTGEYSAIKLISALEGDWNLQKDAIETVVKLLERRIAGENVNQKLLYDAIKQCNTAAIETKITNGGKCVFYCVSAAIDAVKEKIADSISSIEFAVGFYNREMALPNTAIEIESARKDLIAALNSA